MFWQTLVRNGISSAPVYNSETQSYVGMLDYRDIVDYVLVVFKKKHLESIDEEKEWSITEIVERAASGEAVPAKVVVGTLLVLYWPSLNVLVRPFS